MKVFALNFLGFLLLVSILASEASAGRPRRPPRRRPPPPPTYNFVVEESNYTRLCKNISILTVNGLYPGPTLYAETGQTIIVYVQNKGNLGITIHWHGVKQPRNPWSDGPEFITQCPIKPGGSFKQSVILSDEEGTLWWHAHSDWSRATVYGAIVIRPKKGKLYPFPEQPYKDQVLILGDWWNSNVEEVLQDFLKTGGEPVTSDALTINGQPGDLYPCSRQDTIKLTVDYGKTYLLRLINAGMNNIFLFGIAHHTLTIVGHDGSYANPFISDYIAISPGQTIDVLLKADQRPDQYYIASKVSIGAATAPFDNSTATAILKYSKQNLPSSRRWFPDLPDIRNSTASLSFSGSLKSVPGSANVPLVIDQKFLFTVSMNTVACNNTIDCSTANNRRFKTSVNNITLQFPKIDILEAYHRGMNGIYGEDFPKNPPYEFNYTGASAALSRTPINGTEVIVLPFNTTVELVYQGTNLLGGIEHPMHLHGYSFYVVGWGLGNFNKDEDPKHYNLRDPPLLNTISVPRNGWTAIRFRADNPGVWFMHCHIERHITWGMGMTFIVTGGKGTQQNMLPRPSDMPPC